MSGLTELPSEPDRPVSEYPALQFSFSQSVWGAAALHEGLGGIVDRVS